MQAPKETPRRLTIPLAIAAAAILGGILVTAGVGSYRDLAVAQARATELGGEIAAAEARIEALRERVERTENDPLVLERLAREDLGMARPDEVVILLPPDED